MSVPRRRQPRRDHTVPEISAIAKAFAERRIALRLTQQTLADLAGVSRYSVQSLERGDDSIKFGSVLRIADALGLRLDAATTRE